MNQILHKFAAAILCGGQSRRMGTDKALLKNKDGKNLIAQTAEILNNYFNQVVLITNDKSKFDNISELNPYTKINDLHPLSGPVGAIHTALRTLPDHDIFIMAGDMPFVNQEIIINLAKAFTEQDADIALPKHLNHLEPLYAFYSKKTESVFRHALFNGQLSIRESFSKVNTVFLNISEIEFQSGLFINLNTPQDAEQENYFLPKI
jgi:molybdopterin-guanine dinucleotide biosynthesis protein A